VITRKSLDGQSRWCQNVCGPMLNRILNFMCELEHPSWRICLPAQNSRSTGLWSTSSSSCLFYVASLLHSYWGWWCVWRDVKYEVTWEASVPPRFRLCSSQLESVCIVSHNFGHIWSSCTVFAESCFPVSYRNSLHILALRLSMTTQHYSEILWGWTLSTVVISAYTKNCVLLSKWQRIVSAWFVNHYLCD